MSTSPVASSHCDSPPPSLSRARLAAGLLAVAMTVLGFLMTVDLNSKYKCEHDFHHGIDSPVLSVELASNATELKKAVNPECKNVPDPSTKAEEAKAVLVRNTVADCFFIPLYTLFVWCFGYLFAVRADGSQMWHRHPLTGLTIATAAADYLENIGIFRALGGGISDQVAQWTCWPSRVKWTLLGLALLLTFVILLRSENPIYSLATRRLLAIGYLASGILLVVGPWFPVFIGLAVSIFALLVLLQALALLGPYVSDWIPADQPKYENDFCERRQREHLIAVHE